MNEPGQIESALQDENRSLRARVAELEKELTQLRVEGPGGAPGTEPGSVVAQMHRLMADAPVGFAFLNMDFRYEVVNQKLAEMDGIPLSMHIGRKFEEVVPQLAPRARLAYEEVIATGRPILEQEFSVETGGTRGHQCYWSVSWSRVRGWDGRPLGVGCIVRDITGRKRAVDELRVNQHRLELAQSAAGIGSWDWDIQTNEIHCSREHGPLYGLRPSDRAPSYEEWLNLVHPDDRLRIKEAVNRALEGIDNYELEFRVVWPDGTVHWLYGRGRVFRDQEGNPTRVLGVNMDINERKVAENAQRESEERFRTMAESAPAMICASGPDGHATFFNKGWLSFTGRTLQQELGQGWTAGVHPEDRDRALAAIAASFHARRYCHVEYRLCRADGEYRWVLCTGVPRFEQDGTFAGYIGSTIDITALKRSHEMELARLKEESLGALAAGIAHDFHNLLSGIFAETEVLQSDLATDSTTHEGLERIRLVAARASEIVRELMSYAGQEDTAFEPVDLSTLVGEMLQLVKFSISKRAVLKLDLAPNVPKVQANAARIRQVVLNLILNASEALGDREGVLTVAIATIRVGGDYPSDSAANAPPGDYIRLQVSDTGCGIPEESRARIFDPFFTTKAGGRGLGLAAVQGIVRHHGGAIGVVSKPGQGSRFEILLPCPVQRPADLDAIKIAPSAGIGEQNSAVILIVEDEDALRLPVATLLRRQGFTVLEAADGLAAVDLFQARGADIAAVLLDMTLPTMSGREVLEELRRARPDVKVILTSAYGHQTVMTALGGRPPWGYLRKPYSSKEITDLLLTAILSKPE